MTYGYEEKVWEGETCCRCGKELHGKSSMLDDQYFCSEECLGEYLIEKYEDDIEWLDFTTEEEVRQRMLEDKYDAMRDGGWE